MPGQLSEIELEAKTDRELLLLTATRVNSLCGTVAETRELVSLQNGRVRRLEGWRDKAVGVLSVLMVVIPALVAAAVAWLFR